MRTRLFRHRLSLAASLFLLVVLLLSTGLAGAVPQDVPTWGTNYKANSDSTSYGQHEPSLAISRTDPNVVIAMSKDYREANVKHVWIYVSQDGGATWPANLQLHMPGLPPDIPLQSDPVALARDDGRLYAFCLGYDSGHGLFVTWSDDNGNSWHNPSVAITHNETYGSLDDKEWPAIDNNPASPYYHNLYVAWANGGVLLKRSTDGGQTWTWPYGGPNNPVAPGDTEYPYPVVGPDGTVYLFYMEGWGYCADGYIRVKKSTDAGVTWSTAYTVASTSQPCSPIHGGGFDQFRFFSIIAAAVDPNNTNNLWAAWTDDNNIYNGQTYVRYVRSTNGGTTWSTWDYIGDDPPISGRDQITPAFAAQDIGGGVTRLHAFWLDRRADPQNRMWHGYHTATTDGGATWEPLQQVSTQAFDLNLGFPPGSGNAAGDYWGLDAVGPVVMAAWNTTVINNQQDIFVARGLYPTEMVTLTGQVTDAQTGAPLDSAQVSTGSYTVTADVNGIYVMYLAPGAYDVTASAAGHYPQTVSLNLVSGTVIQDFALEPIPAPVILTGQVTDAQSGLPLSGAAVSTGVVTTTAGADGVYTLTLLPGDYDVTASAANHYSQTAAVHLISGTVVQDFGLEPIPVLLTGQVTDAWTGLPLSGAAVSTGAVTTTTGADGVYTLTLFPGDYDVTASAGGYYPQTASVHLVSGVVVQDFSLEPLSALLTGQVTDAQTGLPIDGATVSTGSFTFTTGADGLYSLTLLPGSYDVTAAAAGYFPQMATVELVSGTVVQDFALEPMVVAVTLTGVVSDASTSLPIDGATVSTGAYTATTGADGTYTMILPPGGYTVTAAAAGYTPESAAVALVSGTVVQDFALQPLACPAPVIDAVQIVTDNLTITLTATVTATPPVEYFWSFGDGVTSTLPAPAHTYAGYGAYTVTLTLSDGCGSAEWAGQIVLPAPGQVWKVYLPVVFKNAR